MLHRFVLLALFAGCTATVQSAPPVSPQPPPPPPPSGGVVVAQPPPPPAPQSHPAYLHALTDLRHARAYLVRPASVVIKWDENRAIRDIDAAIAEIRQASIDDGKPLSDHPPVDAGLVWGNRLDKALELVETARRDVNQEEDNAFARGLKNRALGHIDLAARDLREGIEEANAMAHQPPPPPPAPPPPAAHPAYAMALGNLRHARALLERPAQADVKWDEHNAIREIDGAIEEIKDARMDDGQPITEHPPIQPGVVYRDRLREAMKLLGEAAHDLEQREDNAWAKRDRKRAIAHVRNAEHAIHEAVEDRREDKKRGR
ncbi:MAG: hypothetical protein ACM31C_05055 [Acidobacteriota bacterium]